MLLCLLLFSISSGILSSEIHIAIGGYADDGSIQMIVSYESDWPFGGVYWGKSPLYQYYTPSFVDMSYIEPYFHHHSLLTGLAPNTQYTYRLENSTKAKEFQFRTGPAYGQEQPVSFAVFGDTGILTSENTFSLLESHKDKLDFYFHIGDISYADDRLREVTFESVWDQFMARIEFAASEVPYMTCPGNHEATCHSFGDFFCDSSMLNFSVYRARFQMPSFNSMSPSSMFYSFNYGRVHIVSISSETDYPHSPEGPETIWNGGPFGNQLEWLENDLSAALADASIDWIIVGGHRPMYTTNPGIFPWPNGEKHLRAAMEDIFMKYKVDLYLAGHVHAYERNYPIYDNQRVQDNYINPTAPVHIVSGSGGSIEGLTNLTAKPAQEWTAFRYWNSTGVGFLTVHNSTTLQWDFIESESGMVLDSFVLVKNTATK